MRRSTRMGGMRQAAKIVRRLHDQSGSDRAAEQLTETLVGLLADLDIRARQTAVRLLGEVGTDSAIAELEAFRREETVASLGRSAREAIDGIRGREGKIEPIAAENKTEAALKSLEERIEELESQFGEWKDMH